MSKAAIHRIREAAWVLLVFAALVLWHGQARAACDSDVFASVSMSLLEDWTPAPEHSAPSRVSRGAAIAAAKLYAGATPASCAVCDRLARPTDTSPARLATPPNESRHAPRYCARSSRLLR